MSIIKNLNNKLKELEELKNHQKAELREKQPVTDFNTRRISMAKTNGMIDGIKFCIEKIKAKK